MTRGKSLSEMELNPNRRLATLSNSRAFSKKLLHLFYQVYNPEKLASIDSILDSYATLENQLFLQLCEKYNVDEAEFNRFLSAAENCSTGSVDATAEAAWHHEVIMIIKREFYSTTMSLLSVNLT